MQWRSFPITAHNLYRPGWLVSAIWEGQGTSHETRFDGFLWIFKSVNELEGNNKGGFAPPAQFAMACQGCCVLSCGGSFPARWWGHPVSLLPPQVEPRHPAASFSSFSPSSASAAAPTSSYGTAATQDAPPVYRHSQEKCLFKVLEYFSGNAGNKFEMVSKCLCDFSCLQKLGIGALIWQVNTLCL